MPKILTILPEKGKFLRVITPFSNSRLEFEKGETARIFQTSSTSCVARFQTEMQKKRRVALAVEIYQDEYSFFEEISEKEFNQPQQITCSTVSVRVSENYARQLYLMFLCTECKEKYTNPVYGGMCLRCREMKKRQRFSRKIWDIV
jgi:hypothetical protein